MPIENQPDSSAAADYLISYPRSFVTITGNVASAILLRQLLRLSNSAIETDGWVLKSLAEWQELTGMGRREQDLARKSLKEINFLEEELRGTPATLCFRLKHDELAKLLPEANQYAENENLDSNLVCSPEWVVVDEAASPANQFAACIKPLEVNVRQAVSHPQAGMQQINLRIFAGRVSDILHRLESKLGWLKKWIDLQSEQGAENKKSFDQMKLMQFGLLIMVFLILMLCIAIWNGQPDYQNHTTSAKQVPKQMNNAQQNQR